MNIDKKIAAVLDRELDLITDEVRQRNVSESLTVGMLINQLKAHRKVLDDKEDHLLEVYDQLETCRKELSQAKKIIIKRQFDEQA